MVSLTSPADPRTLAKLVTGANEAHRMCKAALQSGLEHACRAGALLIEAKELVGHGAWGSWLERHFDGDARTAQRYVKLAREYGAQLEANPTGLSELSQTQALERITKPSTNRRAIAATTSEDDAAITARQLAMEYPPLTVAQWADVFAQAAVLRVSEVA